MGALASHLLHRCGLCWWPDLRDDRPEVPPCEGDDRGSERGSHCGLELGRAPHLRARFGLGGEAVPWQELFFSTDVKGAIQEADIIFASVNTPTKIKGVGAGRAADLRYIESVGRTVAQYANRPKIIIEKSTVPVKTAEALQRVVSAKAVRSSGSCRIQSS